MEKNYVVMEMDSELDSRVPQAIAVCQSEKEAKEIAEKRIRDLFDLFGEQLDSDGFSADECVESGSAFFRRNANQYYVTVQKVA